MLWRELRQEAAENKLNELDIEWHFIGHIQSNKTTQIAATFDWYTRSIEKLPID